MAHPQSPTRRRIVRQFVAAGMGIPLLWAMPSRAATSNDVVRHACIGVGGMGWSDMHELKSHPHIKIVALCDVDQSRLNRASREVAPDAITVRDWRELFDRHAGAFDSVNITIPDHMHAPVAMQALEDGKHVYCQKPMTKWLGELHQLRDRATRSSVVTQLGIQNHARTEFRLARWALREGLLGRITDIHCWSNKSWGGTRPLPKPAMPPDSLLWDQWIGVAPHRPYAPEVYHPGSWRNWADFGTGLLGDMACHVLDSPLHALQLGAPLRVKSTGPAPTTQNWPDRAKVHFEFAGNERTAEDVLPLTWYDGATKPPAAIADLYPHRLPQTGCMVVGHQGAMLIPHVAGPRLLPAERFADVRFPKLNPINHYHQFVDAIRTGTATDAPLEKYGHTLVETVLIGVLAQHRPNEQLSYDVLTGRFIDGDGLNALFNRPYRETFRL